MNRRVDIVGLGRMGSAFAHAFVDAGWKVRGFGPTRKGRSIPGVEIHEGVRQEDFPAAPLILLTVPDRLISEVADGLAKAPGFSAEHLVAHASGSLGLEPLQGAASQGAAIGSLHPLFAAPPGTKSLAGNWAAVDGSSETRKTLMEVARELGLHPFHVPPEERARYHAAASLAANGLVSLASLSSDLFLPLGLRKDEALRALLPLLRSALDGLERRGLPEGLTGPVARGDGEVVDRHLQVLSGKEAAAAYRALSLHAVSLARQIGEADEEALKRIEDALQS